MSYSHFAFAFLELGLILLIGANISILGYDNKTIELNKIHPNIIVCNYKVNAVETPIGFLANGSNSTLHDDEHYRTIIKNNCVRIWRLLEDSIDLEDYVIEDEDEWDADEQFTEDE